MVKKGIFMEELTDQGTVEAVNSISVSAPAISYRYGALKIAKIVDDGAEVEKGDTIMIFDPSEIKRSIIQAEQQLEIAKAEYEKLKSTQQSEIEDLEADLELAGISQEISKINFETSVYEPEATKKEIQLKLESATIALNRAKEQIENKKDNPQGRSYPEITDNQAADIYTGRCKQINEQSFCCQSRKRDRNQGGELEHGPEMGNG